MSVFLITIISMAALAVMLFGLFGPREIWDLETGAGFLSRLGRRKERLLRLIKDLEEQHALGSIDERDFQELRREYKALAIQVMRELDRARAARVRHVATGSSEVPQAIRNRIENEVSRRRRETQKAKGS